MAWMPFASEYLGTNDYSNSATFVKLPFKSFNIMNIQFIVIIPLEINYHNQ